MSSGGMKAPGFPDGRPGALSVRFPIPAGVHRVEEEIQRSRFLTTLAPAPDEATARALLEEVRVEHPDATHHCWAFVAGPPGSTARIGMSDDGEPAGTAGRPILQALLHGGVGEVVAVVTRYYGGVKLGKGGLGRAYAGGVKAALATLPTRTRVDREILRVEVAYPFIDPLRRLLESSEGEVTSERYGAGATLEVSVPQDRIEGFLRELANVTSGEARVVRESARKEYEGAVSPRPRPADDGSDRSA